jgi:hypothetical protein
MDVDGRDPTPIRVHHEFNVSWIAMIVCPVLEASGQVTARSIPMSFIPAAMAGIISAPYDQRK